MSSDYPQDPQSRPQPAGNQPAPEQDWRVAPQPAPSEREWHYAAGVAPDAPERVAAGLAGALVAVVAGMVLTVVIWRAGFIASITSFAMAAGAVFLYSRGAGRAPRKGLGPLIALIVVGVVASFFGVIASDAWDFYTQNAPADAAVSRTEFVMDNIVDGEVISSYGKDMAMFGVFAVLGIFGTLRRLVRS